MHHGTAFPIDTALSVFSKLQLFVSFRKWHVSDNAPIAKAIDTPTSNPE
jgi:hypothetical protein